MCADVGEFRDKRIEVQGATIDDSTGSNFTKRKYPLIEDITDNTLNCDKRHESLNSTKNKESAKKIKLV